MKNLTGVFIGAIFLVAVIVISLLISQPNKASDSDISRSFCGGKAVETYYLIANEKTGEKEKMFRCAK